MSKRQRRLVFISIVFSLFIGLSTLIFPPNSDASDPRHSLKVTIGGGPMWNGEHCFLANAPSLPTLGISQQIIRCHWQKREAGERTKAHIPQFVSFLQERDPYPLFVLYSGRRLIDFDTRTQELVVESYVVDLLEW